MALPRSILLIITGSVASYKALELIRLLRAENITVTAILTKAGAKFITPLAVSALTGTKTYDELFSLTDEVEMGHIQLSRIADLVLVAPASADILAKMASGIADDLATTALLATDKPVMVVPAMNHRMWSHAATQRNISQLLRDGVHLIAPTEGDMACGEHGVGRMAEPAAIMEVLKQAIGGATSTASPLAGEATRLNKRSEFSRSGEGASKLSHNLSSPSPLASLDPLPQGQRVSPATRSVHMNDLLSVADNSLAGKKVIITSGPTVEAIDPVRYLGNRSSGKQGHAIAAALAAAGAEVTLISGSVTIPDPAGVRYIIHTGTADAMLTAVEDALPADIFIGAAAVADWRLSKPAKQKLKKKTTDSKLTLELVPTVDILASVAKHKQRPTLVIGFAAETEKLLEHARAKRLAKGCDWLIANEVGTSRAFGADDNTVTLITPDAEESWPLASKQDIAGKLVRKIAEHFLTRSTTQRKNA